MPLRQRIGMRWLRNKPAVARRWGAEQLRIFNPFLCPVADSLIRFGLKRPIWIAGKAGQLLFYKIMLLYEQT